MKRLNPRRETAKRSTAIDQEYTEHLEELLNFSEILNSTLDSSLVRERAMQATCRLLRSEGATMYLVDKEKNELFFEAIVGQVGTSALKEIRLAIDESSLAGSVALHRKSLMVQNVASEKRHFQQADNKSKLRTRNMVAVPMLSKGILVGVLQAINREGNQEFRELDLRLLETLAHQVAIAIDNAKLYQDLKNSFYETIAALASAIDMKDRYTGGHTKRVAYFSEMIARYMGCTKEEVEEVKLGAILHDIGKIGVEDLVLKKNAPLEKAEWEIMKEHPEHGYKILAHVKGLKKITDGMRFHHERPDGFGYPLGLKGEEIPLIARIISVADTFDAMTSNRPYRKGLDYDTAFEEIVRQRGTQFDEKVVDAFIEAFKMERMGKKRSLRAK